MNGPSIHGAQDADTPSPGNLQDGAQVANTGHPSQGRPPTNRRDAERLTSQLERFLGRGPLSGQS